jgi:peptide-methionine (R)-S-oxide reductase
LAAPTHLADSAGALRSRRQFLCVGVGAAVAAALSLPANAAAAGKAGAGAGGAGDVGAAPAATVLIEDFWDDGSSRYQAQVPRVIKTDAQWRALLSPLAFEVTRRDGTEPAFSGAYLHNRQAGVYRCVGCATALFSSRDQYDPASGWLGFRRAISRYNLAESLDDNAYEDPDTDCLAVSCRRCDAHLGQVSAGGAPPSALTYRINCAALRFAPASRD